MRYAFPAERIMGLLDAESGLASGEVAERRRVYGDNQIVKPESRAWGDIVRDTARDPMVWFLVATALLFALLGDYAEAVILALAIVPIVGMDAYLHRRTQATTEGLAGRLEAEATVVRDGETTTVASGSLVPGDLVLVGEGHSFPADGLVVAGRNLQVDESALTGEAMPVRKRAFEGSLAAGAADAEVTLGEAHWAAAGTRLLTGEARLRVVFTGGETVYGQIVRSAQEGHQERTPLQSAIASLIAGLVATAVLCTALALTRYYQGYGLVDAFVSAVTLAVAALPEEFPVVFTFFLPVGVYRLARRQALVRRSVVVENIGRVTCICSDKTGTITEGHLRLAHLVPPEGLDESELRCVAQIASRPGSGDPMDAAVHEEGAVPEESLATFPFTEDRRRETAIVRHGAGYRAPSKVRPRRSSRWLISTNPKGRHGRRGSMSARPRDTR